MKPNDWNITVILGTWQDSWTRRTNNCLLNWGNGPPARFVREKTSKIVTTTATFAVKPSAHYFHKNFKIPNILVIDTWLLATSRLEFFF
jgi:hypothetical protein